MESNQGQKKYVYRLLIPAKRAEATPVEKLAIVYRVSQAAAATPA